MCGPLVSGSVRISYFWQANKVSLVFASEEEDPRLFKAAIKKYPLLPQRYTTVELVQKTTYVKRLPF